nr:DsrE/DsrF/DrsH-like family protein [Lachnospiraceae bacterium]
LNVTIVEKQKQLMTPLDEDMARLVYNNIMDNGTKVLLEDGVTGFKKNADAAQGKIQVLLESNNSIACDMVIMSIGIRPNNQLAKDAGLELSPRGGVLVNDYMRTKYDHIYAVGDVACVKSRMEEENTMVPLAGPANRQARICADVINGDIKTYCGVLGTSIAKVFDLNVASTGFNEKDLKARGKEKNKDYYTATILQKSHAGYYPNAVFLTMKLIFDAAGNVLGAQIIGEDGVDKRIDTIATIIGMKGNVTDLMEMETAYAPPFSSAKDPVNMLGFTAENILKGLVEFVDPLEYDELAKAKDFADNSVLLDVREVMEANLYTIPGSVNIPLGQLRQRIDELSREKTIYVYCAIGVRAYNAARILRQNGFFDVKVISGGSTLYRQLHKKYGFKDAGNTKDSQTNGQANAPVVKAAETTNDAIANSATVALNCCGMQCPGPIMKVNETMNGLKDGDVIQVRATDPGFPVDVKTWCERTGNRFVGEEKDGMAKVVVLQKGNGETKAAAAENTAVGAPEGKTLIVFDGDLDKVLASFIIANGARAMGRPVTMFFTFWGLNALRKNQKVSVKKSFIEKMFGAMMPRGSKKLKLSKMNMGGMGTAMMKKVMKDKNVSTLEDLMKAAMDSGIRLVACTMSMDVMGIRKEELIDGVELAGVASYLGDAEQSNVNLFI